MRSLLKRNAVKRYLPLLPRHISSLFMFIFLSASIVSIGTGLFLSPALAEAQGSEKAILHRHHPLVREAIGVQHRHLHWLMSIPDVVGTGVGIGSDGLPVIKVFTARHGVKGIPEWLELVPVEVEVTGMVVALACPKGPAGWCDRPVPIGVSTGHPDITAGTIGCRVTDGTDVYALSNNHVYANSDDDYYPNEANSILRDGLGDNVLQPGPYDRGRDPRDRIGELYAFVPIDFSVFGSNKIDAAIARTTINELGTATLPDGYGSPSSVIQEAYVGLPVKKYGRTTHLTYGRVSEISVTIIVCYANCSHPLFAKLAWFDDQIGIISDNSVPFSLGGDSGSLIVTHDENNEDNNNNPVGLLFAGSDTITFANRIDLVLNAFGVTIDDGTGTTPPPPPPPTQPAAPSRLVAKAVSNSEINLTWTDNANNEDGFKIERCEGSTCGNFSQIASVNPNVKGYLDTGLSRRTTYRYRVRAYNGAGDSNYSNIAKATTRR